MTKKTFPKLRGKIVEKYGSQRQFANVLNKTEQTVISKLNKKSEFSKKDILLWAELLDIPETEVAAYFFAE